MNVLVIDNNMDRDCWGAPDLVRLSAQNGHLVHVRRGPQEDLPKDTRGFDRLVVSGSRESCFRMDPWAQRLDDLIRNAVSQAKPVLGVCYGHQALVRALGGEKHLRASSTPEYGWTEIELLEDSTLFEGLPRRFHTYSWHREEACSVPEGMKILARSQNCPVQAVQLEGKPAFGIQFHPEKELEDAERSLDKCRKQKIGPVLRPGDGRKLFNANIGKRIFENFLRAS